MTLRWDKPLKVGKADVYSVTVSADWHESESLTGAFATLEDDSIANFTPGYSTTYNGHDIYVPLTGVAPGYMKVTVNYSTETRSDSVDVLVKVE